MTKTVPDGPAQTKGTHASASTAERRVASRATVAMPVMCRYDSVLDFVKTQSMNISESGMFVVTDTPAALGSRISFNFSLADGFTLLRGMAEVMRVVTSGPVNGMGLRFVDLDDTNRALIARIVEVNSQEGRNSTMNFDFSRAATGQRPALSATGEPLAPRVAAPAPIFSSPLAPLSAPVAAPAPPRAPPPAPLRPIHFDGKSVRVLLGPHTAQYFTQNPLLNVRSGGFFIPAEEEFPLGTVFQIELVDGAGVPVVTGKGKVVAKQDLRIGLRLTDVDKDALARLRAEVEKFGPSK